MTNWWEETYPGGPMVAVKGFPRPLYPPDAAPQYQPSSDGPDCEAYKRTVSRAGRWVWQQFDQTFSNGFSHGKGGNVSETGVAGVQRQGGLDDTGYIGTRTFNLLRSIMIPNGLPHAGEYAMDATAVDMINAAFDKFQGAEPTPPAGRASALARLKRAREFIGVKESPFASNRQQFGVWYGMNGVPWCGIFATFCDQTSASPTRGSFQRGLRWAYIPYVVMDARFGNNGLSVVGTPKPGDLVAFDWDRNGNFDHIGIVETPPDARGTFTTIEGNTSLSNNSNGGQVMQRTRNVGGQRTVFIRVAE